MASRKRKRGSYKDKFVRHFESDDIAINPSTLRNWKKYSIEGIELNCYKIYKAPN